MTLESCIDKDGWWRDTPFVDRRIIVAPAFPGNYYPARICRPIALCLHEPQEESDGRESTPVWFQNPAAHGSTRWYADNDGDLFQCVPFPAAAIANGLDGKPEPRFNDGGPEFNGVSLNNLTDNIEVEGWTHNIAQTFSEAQYQGVCDWLVMGYLLWNLPRNPGRVLSHFQVSKDRSDGEWIRAKSGVVEEAVNRVLKLEKEVADDKRRIDEMGIYIFQDRLRLNGLEAHKTHPPKP